MTAQLPELRLADWDPTRDTLHQYTRIIGKIRSHYRSTYPAPDGWIDLELPEGAYWHTENWIGAILPHAVLAASNRPQELLLGYLRGLQVHGAKLMS